MRLGITMGFACALLGLSAWAEDTAPLLHSSREVAAQLLQQLGAQLRRELAASGAEGAISVCKSAAPEIAGRLSREQGARVARVSLRVRNPLLGTPDAWEQRALTSFDQRAAAGEKPDALELSEFTTEPDGRYFRYVKAIPVQPLCLSCHGPQESIPPAVKARLQEDYPYDRATGYAVGQIRGAVTVKRRISD